MFVVIREALNSPSAQVLLIYEHQKHFDIFCYIQLSDPDQFSFLDPDCDLVLHRILFHQV